MRRAPATLGEKSPAPVGKRATGERLKLPVTQRRGLGPAPITDSFLWPRGAIYRPGSPQRFGSGSIPIRSLTASRSACIRGSVRWSGWRRAQAGTGSDPTRHRLGGRASRRSSEGHVGASFSIPARVAVSRTTSHSTFGVIPLPQIRPLLLIDRKSAPSVMAAAPFHASTASFTHAGIGMVRMCPALPRKSATT